MKVGDLVHFISPEHREWVVRTDTRGIVLGFKSGRVEVKWLPNVGGLPTPTQTGYWRMSSLKVFSENKAE